MSVTCNLMGGLGNQLFQIFAVMDYAKKSGTPFIFQFTEILKVGKKRPTYWNNILNELLPYTQTSPIKCTIIYSEQQFPYSKIPLYKNKDNNITIIGYFQSPKYFEKSYIDICSFLDLPAKINKLKHFKYHKDISIHFRMDDYINNICHPVMPYKYYTDAINIIINNDSNAKTVLYFYQSINTDLVLKYINKLILDFPTLSFIPISEKLADWEQMLVMSLCTHNIIANSSFSWWGAYLNNNKNKTVCLPDLWFTGPLSTKDTSELIIDTWTKIHVKL